MGQKAQLTVRIHDTSILSAGSSPRKTWLQSVLVGVWGVEVHTSDKRDGAVLSAKRASTDSTSQETTFRCCRRQVSTTVSNRSTNRLPAEDCVPNDNFRQITA